MIEEFGLHDAVLIAVHVTWGTGTCILTVRHPQLADCTLIFTGVSNLVFSHMQPWGPSQSINSASERNKGQFEIEMQSGDWLNIDANDVALTPSNADRRN